jgi:hypothetical protein
LVHETTEFGSVARDLGVGEGDEELAEHVARRKSHQWEV